MTVASYILVGLVVLIIIVPLVIFGIIWLKDEKQEEHSVLRNYPVLGKMRYILEKIGPELRQYLFHNDNEARPFSRRQYQDTVISAKYKNRMMGFGSERDFDGPGYYVRNAMYPVQRDELKVDNEKKIRTKIYKIDKDNLFRRQEHREYTEADPFYLRDDDAIVIGGDTCRKPFKVKGFVGQSAMSYGALGEKAITALSTGLGMAGGTWMNTGEGGLSQHHLKGGVDIIYQIGPGLFGVRTKDGEFSWEEFKRKSEIEEVKAFELKFAQGAKTRGGHVDGSKVTPEIAEIRNVEPWKTVDSPNRFRQFNNNHEMFEFIEKLREIGGKPVGIKIVVGNLDDLEAFAKDMKESGKGPDFITVDGGEGGTGASFQELADAAGLPIRAGLPLVHDMLTKYGVRDRVKIFASGKLLTPDKIVMAMTMGADLVNIARGLMFSVGCIQAQVCHTNNCPVGVATTDPKLQRALIVEEKSFRTCNYLLSLREGVFNLAAAAGIDTPTKFERKHLIYKDEFGRVYPVDDLFKQAEVMKMVSG
ncbi:FMN-binding glutamate synthase family protein [Falsibacillus pallidus]|uniref:Glutamate synthase domain-containing protein 2 n=1 Tax=Falsibacillus pallidus TaxID=493781 RepID=A0A370GF40_9BACI|nr:FMN-binding glutamate synthase family protein [Falsibacillus pallidus]RDI41024.1 glutamate synthase domain-containing protein 2 [Falsibacillus pallidus]